MSPIHITDNAKNQIKMQIEEYKAESGLDAYIELSIKHKGCSGLAYNMEFVIEPQPKDYKIEEVPLVLKADSLMWIMGTFVDYENTGITSGFIFVNPHQKRSCHCGEAFYV